ncbi:BMC domain-containing protein [Eubacterium barkeri]|uniref:Carboxysome shell and ethanolamine utilization microcompartment protein CcmL/EutN n=1 Tax=Eubacterium barkeri TaxID=1528 RepID=A0A1H3I053_EUBBA|nr:BMC domain-containing protein [Eubacterium barkeri]SDY21002.1 Carboxysome shell and ethanolamine utilization microcompartment protein CcmL/EutN [Eubacterium barkeri]
MKRALGMIELTSIARGIITTDAMLKAAQVDLVRASTVCPGKYIVLISGDVGEIRASMEAGIHVGAAYVVNTLLIPNIHEQLVPSLMGTVQVVETEAVGVLEFYSIAAAITAADTAVKAAQVTLLEVRIGYAIGGKGFVTLTGDVGAVKAAVSAANLSDELLVETAVIPRPAEALVDSLL